MVPGAVKIGPMLFDVNFKSNMFGQGAFEGIEISFISDVYNYTKFTT